MHWDTFIVPLQPVFCLERMWLKHPPAFVTPCVLWPWRLSCPGGHKLRNRCFQPLQEQEVEIDAKDLIWRSSHFPSRRLSWVMLKAQYLVQEQEDTFKLGQNIAPCFLLRNAQNLFFLDHTCLALKGCLLTPEPPYFLKCYSSLDLAPKTEANVILHIQQVIFQRTPRACSQSLIFPRKFKSHSRSEVQCPISERALPMSRVGNALRCIWRRSHGYSTNVHWAATLCLALGSVPGTMTAAAGGVNSCAC